MVLPKRQVCDDKERDDPPPGVLYSSLNKGADNRFYVTKKKKKKYITTPHTQINNEQVFTQTTERTSSNRHSQSIIRNSKYAAPYQTPADIYMQDCKI